MASALRYMALRHSLLVMCSTQESSVPEWLRPIQKMKLARYVPHTEGWLTPAAPIP